MSLETLNISPTPERNLYRLEKAPPSLTFPQALGKGVPKTTAIYAYGFAAKPQKIVEPAGFFSKKEYRHQLTRTPHPTIITRAENNSIISQGDLVIEATDTDNDFIPDRFKQTHLASNRKKISETEARLVLGDFSWKDLVREWDDGNAIDNIEMFAKIFTLDLDVFRNTIYQVTKNYRSDGKTIRNKVITIIRDNNGDQIPEKAYILHLNPNGTILRREERSNIELHQKQKSFGRYNKTYPVLRYLQSGTWPTLWTQLALVKRENPR